MREVVERRERRRSEGSSGEGGRGEGVREGVERRGSEFFVPLVRCCCHMGATANH